MSEIEPPTLPAAGAGELPKNIEFYEVFRDVLNRWAYLDCQPQGHGEPNPSLKLERSILLAGATLHGLLVLRSDLGFGRLLAESATGEAVNDAQAQDAFTELCNQFCSHAMTQLWDAAEQGFRPFLPRPSAPADWPEGAADRSLLLGVERSLVEMHFWRLAP